MPGIDHLEDQSLWSESVYLDCVSPDGETGFVVRLCRYPTERTGWLWAHVFLPGKVFAYTDHYLACPESVTAVEAPDVRYDLGAGSPVAMDRAGPREQPRSASVRVHFQAHAEAHPGHGPGSHHVLLSGSFHPLSASGTSVAGRIELLGSVSGLVTIDDSEYDLLGFGQWHEQHQEGPRFLRPFTYATLRGERLAFVATRGPLRATGYVRREGEITPVTAFDIGPRGPRRALRLELADGTELRGEARTTHEYSVPIYDTRRPGTLVVAEVGGERLSGCINDFMRE
ncbi:MAG TPA: hypothetical protein VNN10_08930 [Dehalococcoidia bacterium]|nr:hypothetical protein [Dehalococcoidia bacterium]